MYTGTQKKAVILKTGENSCFEEAFFILKDDLSSLSESEMIREANSILKNNYFGGYFFENEKTVPKKHKANSLTSFLLGALISFAVCTVLFLVVK